MHGHLLERFLHHWNQRAKTGQTLVPPSAFDIALLRGDTFLVDWRISTLKPGQFAMKQAMQIARLSSTPGAYWVPGGYKQQVYVRYLTEGKLTRLSPSMTAPDGVDFKEGTTREMSVLYRQARADWDRSAKLESILQNFQQAEENSKLIKKVKYGGRFVDPRPLTNLEVDFRFLHLRGKTDVIEMHLKRLFKDGVPPEIGTLADALDLVRRMDEIELDKIIGAMGSAERPKWWAEEWRSREAKDYTKAAVLDAHHLAKESQAVVAAARAAGRDLSGKANLEQRVALAEEMFNRKAMALGRHLARDAAVEMFREVFTSEGFARHRAAEGVEAAHRQVIERALGLRSALAFIDDPEMIRGVLDAAPPELRPVLRQIAEIPEAQRKLIRQRKGITAQDLQEIIPLIDDLRAKLAVSSMPPVDLAELPENFGFRRRLELLAEQVLKKLPQGIPPDEAPLFFRLAQVPTSPADWVNKAWERGADIGTVDTAFKILTSYATGNPDAAMQQFKEGVAETVFGPAWNLAAAYRDARDTGSSWPFVKFAATSTAPLLGFGPQVAAATALWGISNSVYQLAWHFYMQPNVDLAVSYVLMGDDTALKRGAAPSSRGPGALSGLREAALLRKHVAIPDLSAADRANIARSLFWADANRETMQALPPGTVRVEAEWNWRDAFQRHRDSILAEHARSSEYWLRRLWFYQRITLPFRQWARQLTADPDWQRIAEAPPAFMQDWSDSSQQEAFPDAFQRSSGRILWDHERIWLRRYLNNWIDEYVRQMGRSGDGEAMRRYLRSASSDWETAVVNHLIAYYREGELQEAKARDEGAQKQLAAKAAAAVAAAGAELARRVADVADAANRAAAEIEQFYWHPELADRLGKAMIKAAEAQRPVSGAKPQLRVRLYSPVVTADGELQGEYLVLGDARLLPDDLESSVSYGEMHAVAGRPAEVTAHRVRALLGADFPLDRLMVLKGTATFTVKSASQVGSSLAADHEVLVIAQRPADARPPVSEVRPSLITVPSLAGMNSAEAMAALRNLGLRPKAAVTGPAPAPNLRHTAHGTRPLAGSQVARDSEVVIDVFGDARTASLTAPDLRGLSLAEAESRIAAGGFFTRREALGAAPQGQPHLVVAAQSPAPGAPIQRGDPLTIRFHDRPAATAMPNLIGLTTEQAQAAVRTAGLRPAWKRLGNAPSAAQANRIGSQTPAAGAPVRPGLAVEAGYFDTFIATVLMPNVQGRVAEEARVQLTALGLNVNLIRAGPPPARD